ncbi:MAG: thermonuclease family protein [Desulfovibrionaceae bacterium]
MAPTRKTLRALLLGLALATAAAVWQWMPPAADAPVQGQSAWKLLRIIDGDTLVMNGPEGQEHVRLIGVDAPELRQEFGSTARAFAADFLARGGLILELDQEHRDQYDRLLAYVWSGDAMLNEALVATGLALAVDYPPNERHRKLLTRAQERARTNHAGFWAVGGLKQTPRQFRER